MKQYRVHHTFFDIAVIFAILRTANKGNQVYPTAVTPLLQYPSWVGNYYHSDPDPDWYWLRNSKWYCGVH